MKLTRILFIATAFFVGSVSVGWAQLHAAGAGPIVYGHHHVNATDLAAHKRFWANTLGGVPTAFGQSEMYKFPNVHVFVREREPTGGTKGSAVNHIGFRVPSVRAVLGKVRAVVVVFKIGAQI